MVVEEEGLWVFYLGVSSVFQSQAMWVVEFGWFRGGLKTLVVFQRLWEEERARIFAGLMGKLPSGSLEDL